MIYGYVMTSPWRAELLLRVITKFFSSSRHDNCYFLFTQDYLCSFSTIDSANHFHIATSSPAMGCYHRHHYLVKDLLTEDLPGCP